MYVFLFTVSEHSPHTFLSHWFMNLFLFHWLFKLPNILMKTVLTKVRWFIFFSGAEFIKLCSLISWIIFLRLTQSLLIFFNVIFSWWFLFFMCYRGLSEKWRIWFFEVMIIELLFDKLIVAEFILTFDFVHLGMKDVFYFLWIRSGKWCVKHIIDWFSSWFFFTNYFNIEILKIKLFRMVILEVIWILLNHIYSFVKIQMKKHLSCENIKTVWSNTCYYSKVIFYTFHQWF